jgi:hypothetical protein
MNTRQRLIVSAHLLIAIERKRKSCDAPGLFNSVEREIISRELEDLETEWSTNDPDRCFARAASAAHCLNAPNNDERDRRV